MDDSKAELTIWPTERMGYRWYITVDGRLLNQWRNDVAYSPKSALNKARALAVSKGYKLGRFQNVTGHDTPVKFVAKVSK